MNSNNNIPEEQLLMEQIDAYLLGTFTPAERSDFESRLGTDLKLQQKVAQQRQQMQAVEISALKASLEDFHQEVEEEQKSKRKFSNWMAIAASIVLILGVSLWFLLSTGSSTQKVFSRNFVPDPGLPTTMSSNSQFEFYSGMVSYKQKNYSDAILSWEPLYAANPKNDTVVYFLGVAHLANGNTKQAQTYLELSNAHANSSFPEETQYYLALTYIKENKVEKAKKLLKKSNYPPSKTLLREINSLR